MPIAAIGLFLLLAAAPCRAGLYSFPSVPEPIRVLALSQLAEAGGDFALARASAESLALLEPRSSYAATRVAQLLEAEGADEAALLWGDRALALDSINVSAAMLVGRMRLRAGDFAIAVKALTPPLRALGAPPEAYALRAIAHELNRNYDAAIADLRRTDVLLPDFAWVANGVLGLALEENRLEEAYQALELALELSPGDAHVLANGIVLARRAEDRRLEEVLLRERAIAEGSTPAEIAEYGAFLAARGRTADMDQLVRWADARGVEPVGLRVATAGSLLDRQEPGRALETLEPCREDPRSLSARARAHLWLGEEGKALRCLREGRRLGILRLDDSLDLAYLEIRSGDRRTGLLTLECVRPDLFGSPRRVVRGSLCYSLLGHPEEAVALLREAANQGVESPLMYQELGVTAFDMGDSLVAEWAFQRLRRMGRETSECMYYLGASGLARGDRDLAAEHLERSVDLDGSNGRALLLLGQLRFDLGQLEMARELLIRAAAVPATASEANRTLARVCRALRMDAEAREAESRVKGRPAPPPAGLTLSKTP
jgi:tetratricopeptide (TPR) repeat protein